MDLSGRHPWEAGPFRPTWHQPRFQRLGVTVDQGTGDIDWRQSTFDRFRAYPSLNAKLPPSVALPGVTVYTVFHAAPSFDAARSICQVGFVHGYSFGGNWFGQGSYFSFELDYVVDQYGRADAEGNIAVLVCNVVVGNLYPVIELPHSGKAKSLKGKPAVPKYDAHGVFVQEGVCLPHPPAQWDVGSRTFSELVVFEGASILPRCVIGLKRHHAKKHHT
jgi:hypothetical protein